MNLVNPKCQIRANRRWKRIRNEINSSNRAQRRNAARVLALIESLS